MAQEYVYIRGESVKARIYTYTYIYITIYISKNNCATAPLLLTRCGSVD